MKRWLKQPHLPNNTVKLCVLDTEKEQFAKELCKLGVRCLSTKDCPLLNKPGASHADMVLHHLGGNRFILAEGEAYLTQQLKEEGAQIQICPIEEKDYPHDVPLNGVKLGKYLIYNPKTLLPSLETEYLNQGAVPIAVTQGYTKCSVAIVNKEAIITADDNIAAQCRLAGLDVLKIFPGHIGINRYSYGFIGGCCGLISPHELAFTGNIALHPQYDAIYSFLKNHHVDAVCLSKEPLWDIGGILPLQEELGNS